LTPRRRAPLVEGAHARKWKSRSETCCEKHIRNAQDPPNCSSKQAESVRKLCWPGLRTGRASLRATMLSHFCTEGAKGQITPAGAATDLPGGSRLAECPAAGPDARPGQGAAARAQGHGSDDDKEPEQEHNPPRAQAEESAESHDLTAQDSGQRACEPMATHDRKSSKGDAEDEEDADNEDRIYCQCLGLMCCIEWLAETLV